MSQAERKVLADWILENPIEFACLRTGSNPCMPDNGDVRRHFRCTLTTDLGTMDVIFSQGSAHTSDPTLEDVLGCIAFDSANLRKRERFRRLGP